MLTIDTISVTPYQQNARVLIDTAKNEAVLIDPGGDVDRILLKCPDYVQVTSIWITHSHIDHVSGVRSLLDRFSSCSIQVVAHMDDQFNRTNLAAQSQMLQFPYSGDFDVSLTCSHGDDVFVGDYSFNVLHTPGHALGHVAFFMAESTNSFNSPVLISGDTLFKGSIGRTDLPGGNHDQLIASIQDHIFSLPDDTVVCSGHGPNTTIGNEKQFNPFF